MNPQFPIYIVSKGRHETRLTSRTLEEMGVPYFIIVESQEFSAYASVIDKRKILVLDPKYQREYNTFSKLGENKGTGSGPARNFAWDHAVSLGAPWQWTMDDNIRHFYRLNRNTKIRVSDGTVFKCMEDFCLRYKNVAMAGPHYYFMLPRKQKFPPCFFNTRIYSCNLIRCDVPFRWRGRYNEDTDLSLRMLKAGWCTVIFNAFLQGKTVTGKMKGGNTDSIYVGGTREKSRQLVEMHPDVARMIWKYDRWHHFVDYTPFKKNQLIRNEDVAVDAGTNEYGMKLLLPGVSQ